MTTDTQENGTMDMAEHQATWQAFMAMTKWGTISVAIVLILMAIFLL